jgi:ABC-2 type transport system permease protein
VLLWGSLGAFVAQENTTSRAGTAYLLAGILLFHVLYQVQIGVATGFMEETWSRNLLNIMTTPITELEYAAGIASFGLAKLVMGMTATTVAAIAFFGFNIGSAGWGLLPIVAILMLTGWALSLFVIGLILRYGQSAEILAWGVNFVVLAISGVFNPVEAIPGPIQPIARVLPTTHAFAAARTLVDGDPLPWNEVVAGAIGAFVVAIAGMAFLVRMLGVFRSRGYITRFS